MIIFINLTLKNTTTPLLYFTFIFFNILIFIRRVIFIFFNFAIFQIIFFITFNIYYMSELFSGINIIY